MTNEEQERRRAFEDYAYNEIPKLTNIKAVVAYEYFKYGWEAANAKNSKPIVDNKVSVKPVYDFNETSLQIATVMALKGTDKQKEEARSFFKEFLTKV